MIDSAPVQGLADTSGHPVYYSFYQDQPTTPEGRPAHEPFYVMALDTGPLPVGATNGRLSQIMMPNGVMIARVEFATPTFTSLEAAKGWLGSQQAQQLKAILLSVRYR